MWCRTCRQDVLGIATAPPGPSRCVRCGTILNRDTWPDAPTAAGIEKLTEHGVALDGPRPTRERPTLDTLADDWELSAAVAKARRWATLPAAASPQIAVIDSAHARVAAPHMPPPPAAPPLRPAPARRSPLSFIAWFVLLNGLSALVCGGVLLAWSVLADRTELWELGMPVALGGQAALLLGLILQLEKLWHGSRHAAVELAKVEERLHGVERAAEVLGATHGPNANSFYAHLADGAGPHVLLADLKGQLDLLATRMADRRAG